GRAARRRCDRQGGDYRDEAAHAIYPTMGDLMAFKPKTLALVAVLVSTGACASGSAELGARNVPAPPPRGVRIVYNVDVDHAWEVGRGRDQLLARAVVVVRSRIDALFRRGVVRAVANGVEVVLPEADTTTLERYRSIALRPGRFQVRLVDDGSPYM